MRSRERALGHRPAAQRRQVDYIGRADALRPALERRQCAADVSPRRLVHDAQQPRRRLQLRGAQRRQPLDQQRRVLEQHVVAEVTLLGRVDDARRPRERRVEARQPAVAADFDAGSHEVVAVERQHDIDLGALCQRAASMTMRSAPQAAEP